MLVLARCKGEKIEIEGCALIRIGRIEEHRVRVDVTAPFSRAWRAEQPITEPSERIARISVLGIRPRGSKPVLRASLGIHVPVGSNAWRAEVVQQQKPREQRFPWHRYHCTARFWRSLNEEIHIEVPAI